MKRANKQPLRAIKKVKPSEDVECTPVPMEPMENVYEKEVRALRAKYPNWSKCFHSEALHEQWTDTRQEIEEATSSLVEKYAWAIPDGRALDIIAAFAPLIEVGAGKGYWARLLQGRGVDIIPFDKFLPSKKAMWTPVRRGGPEVLSTAHASGRALLLCYPDEAESMAAACLDHFTGEYIIHVGELVSTGTAAGAPVAPFGRTSSAEFQVTLAESFHCLLSAELTNRLPISRDCISVWKRTRFVAGGDKGTAPTTAATAPVVEENPKKKKSKTKSNDSAVEFVSASDLAALREAALDVQYSEDQDNLWAVIPEEECLPIDRAAPCLMHLLKKG